MIWESADGSWMCWDMDKLQSSRVGDVGNIVIGGAIVVVEIDVIGIIGAEQVIEVEIDNGSG
jgi:hypothetical protein